ncbi:MAG: hypothetical protein OXH15_16335 [Gammaproteobacteria bacterium]|nr:hypothetical protein [Gammaproteobacteria bacterium]
MRLGTDGMPYTVEIVCRKDAEPYIEEYLLQLASANCDGDVVETSVAYDMTGTLAKAGFTCGREAGEVSALE